MRSELRPEEEGQRLDYLSALAGAQGPDALSQLRSVQSSHELRPARAQGVPIA